MILGVYAVGLLSDKPPENTVQVSSTEVKSHPSFDNGCITVSFRLDVID